MSNALCATCGDKAISGCRQCGNCFEVERRLPDYLMSAQGRRFVQEALDQWAGAERAGLTAEQMLAQIRAEQAAKKPAAARRCAVCPTTVPQGTRGRFCSRECSDAWIDKKAPARAARGAR